MRLRRKPWIDEAILEYKDFLATELPADTAGRWRDIFGGDAPLWVELGTGKGRFTAGLAAAHPDVFIVGLEVQRGVLYYVGKKVAAAGLKNVRLAEFDIEHIETAFAPNEVDRLYINFCDPWPKARHAKRRLTHRRFLAKYRRILRPGGEIHFKTDNRDLFYFSLDEWREDGWELREVTDDLHANEPATNIRTEYENKFAGAGHPIYRAVAVLPEV